ncbi:MAG: hypothetical protein ACKPKO_56800, partial [Candidatus Fonsibacter sp.]
RHRRPKCLTGCSMVWQPSGPTQPTEEILPRVLELVAPPTDESEWDCDVDGDVFPEVQALVPINDLPQAPPARQMIGIGVDIGGVLFGKETHDVRNTIPTVERVAQMLAAGAWEWFQECVAMFGAEHVFIISYMTHPRMRDLYAR